MNTFEELLFQNNNFFSAIFFQNHYFFRDKHLPRNRTLRTGNSLVQLPFGTATNRRYLQKSYFWRQILLHSINFFKKARFWKKLLFQKSNIPHDLFFQESYLFNGFFINRYLLQQLHFQKSCFFRTYIFRRVKSFHSYTSYYLVINWVSQFKCKRSFVQFKCESSFLCIYYCSKSHHRQSLFNQLATQSAAELLLCNEPTFRVSYFFRVSTF